MRSDFENDVSVSNRGVALPAYTSRSNLTETILAAYTQLDYQLSEKTTLKGGLRYEHTDTQLNSTNGGRVVNRNFGNLFPSIFVNQKLSKTDQLNLSYSKRITRPSFTDMAPFVIFLDPKTSFGGNATLRPAIANTFQADYIHKGVSLSAQYTAEDYTIVAFQNRFNPASQTQLIVPDNLKDQRTASLSLAFPLKATDWWKMNFFTTYLWQESTSIEPQGTFTFSQNNFRLNGSQNIALPKGFGLEVSGFYQTRSLVGK